MELEEIKNRLQKTITHLYDKDFYLLQHDVSERAIAHRLAIYLQAQFTEYNVDCEYNRMYESEQETIKKLGSQDFIHQYNAIRCYQVEKEWYEITKPVSVYPDIIIHKRKDSVHNLLAIEIKKDTNQESQDYDWLKLEKYTETAGLHYSWGASIHFYTKSKYMKEPLIKWFFRGKECQVQNTH